MNYQDNHMIIVQQANGSLKQVSLGDMRQEDKTRQEYKNKPTFVYAISNGKHIKIGKSDDPKGRLYNMQTANSSKLELICTLQCKNQKHGFDIEYKFHKKFKDYKISGEWFNLTLNQLQQEWNEL